jgi:hypothetical protein
MNITKEYRGVTYYGTEESIAKAIELREIEEKTIYKSSVYTYSCRAVRLDDGRVKFTQSYEHGCAIKETIFNNEDVFWKSI